MLRRHFLALWSVEEPKIGLGGGAGAALVNDSIHDGYRRLGQNADRGNNDLDPAPCLGLSQVRLVLPGKKDVAHATLHEGIGGSPGPRIEHGHIRKESRDELTRRLVAATRLPPCVSPGGQVVPPRAA